MFGFLPIIGPIISGIFSTVNRFQDVQLAKIKDDSERIRLQHDLTMKAQDDASLRLARDILVYPVAVWCAIGTWDTLVAESFLSDWMWHVAKFPPGPLEYLPFAVLAYLLGNTYINKK
jgi:hypothetical protein